MQTSPPACYGPLIITEHRKFRFAQAVVVSEFVQERDANLFSQFLDGQLLLIAGGQLNDSFAKNSHNVGHCGIVVGNPLIEGHSGVDPAEIRATTESQILQHLLRGIIFHVQRHLSQEIVNPLRHSREHLFEVAVKQIAEFDIHSANVRSRGGMVKGRLKHRGRPEGRK